MGRLGRPLQRSLDRCRHPREFRRAALRCAIVHDCELSITVENRGYIRFEQCVLNPGACMIKQFSANDPAGCCNTGERVDFGFDQQLGVTVGCVEIGADQDGGALSVGQDSDHAMPPDAARDCEARVL